MPPNFQWMTDFTAREWEHNFHTHPKESPLECVIVEPRLHPWLPGVLRNFSCMFPNAKFSIIYDIKNQEWIEKITDHSTNVRKIGMNLQKDFDISQYCALFASDCFWKMFDSERVLIFQADTGIRKNNILRFWEYSYVGATWGGEVRHLDPWVRVGNGGLSFRDPLALRQVIARFPYNNQHVVEEDLYFCKHLANMDDISWCPDEVATSFSVEHVSHHDPLGFHQTYRYKDDTYLNDVIGNTDPIRRMHNIHIIEDAWVQCKNGRIFDSNGKLATWLGVGLGPTGLRLSKDTLIPYGTDQAPGIAKELHIRLRRRDGGQIQDHVIPLARKRVLFDTLLNGNE